MWPNYKKQGAKDAKVDHIKFLESRGEKENLKSSQKKNTLYI